MCVNERHIHLTKVFFIFFFFLKTVSPTFNFNKLFCIQKGFLAIPSKKKKMVFFSQHLSFSFFVPPPYPPLPPFSTSPNVPTCQNIAHPRNFLYLSPLPSLSPSPAVNIKLKCFFRQKKQKPKQYRENQPIFQHTNDLYISPPFSLSLSTFPIQNVTKIFFSLSCLPLINLHKEQLFILFFRYAVFQFPNLLNIHRFKLCRICQQGEVA